MSVLLERGIGTETVGVEALGAWAEGKPTYGSSVEVNAAVVREDRVIRRKDGSEELTTLTVLVDGGETYLPLRGDRVTPSDGPHIVVQRHEAKTLSGAVDHVMLLCREQ
jgi:hypothetical protein